MKLIKFIYLSLIVAIVISCVAWNNFSTKLKSLYIYNGIVKDSILSDLQLGRPIEKSSDYCIMMDFQITDSLMEQGNRRITTMLSPLNYFFGAYDPAREFNYYFKDNIVDIEIQSLFDFCDTLKSKTLLNSQFEIYFTYRNWHIFNDSINLLKFPMGDNFSMFINNQIQKTNNRSPNFDFSPDFVLRLKNRPDILTQQFVINIFLSSGKLLTDTTEIVSFIN